MWLTGDDGNVWVWVMGDHPNDLSIETIIEEETKANAKKLAEKEVYLNLKFYL